MVLFALLLMGCGDPTAPVPGETDAPTPCDQIIEGCSARRLENLVLRDGATDGALSSIEGIDVSAAIGFDEALAAAGDSFTEAKTVQVILGAADGGELRWGTGRDLFYAIKWGGVRVPLAGPGESPPEFGTWATVVDARTGEYIVGGSSG